MEPAAVDCLSACGYPSRIPGCDGGRTADDQPWKVTVEAADQGMNRPAASAGASGSSVAAPEALLGNFLPPKKMR